MAVYERLYKLNTDESIQVWEIHYNPNFKAYWTVSGKQGGKMVESGIQHVEPKVKRNQKEQCILEMKQKVELKKRARYVERTSEIEDAGDRLPGFTPMLAHDWSKHSKKMKFPVVVQPKLDGVRCLITKDGMFTRGRKPIESCQHVFQELEDRRFFTGVNKDAQLDGELYTHEFKSDFEKIIKAVRKTAEKATDEDLDLQAQVQFHVYDTPKIRDLNSNDTFRSRIYELQMEFHDYENVRVVQTLDAKDEEELMSSHGFFMEEGYEGTMVRNPEMHYEGKRSYNLLKLKDFDDDEFRIIGVNEGKGHLAGHAGTLSLHTRDGQEFKAKMDGSFERLKWIFKNPTEVVGKMATVRYQNLSAYGIPRFPVCKEIRGLQDRSDWL